MREIDARGLSCPEPVLMTKKAIVNDENEYVVRVDNVASRENVTRFLENSGFTVSVDEVEEDYILKAFR